MGERGEEWYEWRCISRLLREAANLGAAFSITATTLGATSARRAFTQTHEESLVLRQRLNC